MKLKLSKVLLWITLGIAFPFVVYADVWYPTGSPINLVPVSSGWGVKADHYTATSTTATSTFPILRDGEIADQHPDGSWTYTIATTSSDLGRGTALLTAISKAQNGDSFYLASTTYDLGANGIDLSNGGRMSTSIHGAGEYQTVIQSEGTSFVIQPAANSVTSYLTINAGYNGAPPWGSVSEPWSIASSTIQNVQTFGQTDGIYIQGTNADNLTVRNVTVFSNWDTVVYDQTWVNSLGASSTNTMNVYDSQFYSNASTTSNICEGPKVSGGGTMNVFNSKVVSSGCSSNNYGYVSYDANIGPSEVDTLNVYGGSILTSGAGAFDLFQHKINDTTILGVTSNTNYNPAKTSGTITYLDNPAIRTSLGSNGASSTVLINQNGVANWQATSSLGISGLSGGFPGLLAGWKTSTTLEATSVPTVAYITATSTASNATSTFNGGIAIPVADFGGGIDGGTFYFHGATDRGGNYDALYVGETTPSSIALTADPTSGWAWIDGPTAVNFCLGTGGVGTSPIVCNMSSGPSLFFDNEQAGDILQRNSNANGRLLWGVTTFNSDFIDQSSKIGIGTTSPYAVLSVENVPDSSLWRLNPPNTVEFAVSSSTGAFPSTKNITLFQIDAAGNKYGGGNVPSVSCAATCSLDAHAHDDGGTIFVSGVQTSVTLTFGQAKPWAPHCTSSDSSMTYYDASTTLTQIVFTTSASIGTGSISYLCEQ